jgi:4-hydroxy-4-methyl-2-oxoglutarate aldolase
VWCPPGDNLAIHVAVAAARPGRALVVAVAGTPERGYWGEVLTTAAEARGVSGLVIDGCVRDVAALERHRFPVFSSGIALRGASKEEGGRVGCAIRMGDAEVRTGDWVVGDSDGVTVVAQADLAAVTERAQARAAREAELFDRLRDGGSTVELLGLDPSRVTTEE